MKQCLNVQSNCLISNYAEQYLIQNASRIDVVRSGMDFKPPVKNNNFYLSLERPTSKTIQMRDKTKE